MSIGSTSSLIAAVCTLAAMVTPVQPAAAHHSFAMYDQSRSETLTGRLTRFIPGANHAQLVFELVDEHGNVISDADGNPEVWGVETGPASAIARQGVTVEAFPLGTVLTVTLNPLRNGKPFGVLDGAIIKCGDVVPEGGCTAQTGESFMSSRD